MFTITECPLRTLHFSIYISSSDDVIKFLNHFVIKVWSAHQFKSVMIFFWINPPYLLRLNKDESANILSRTASSRSTLFLYCEFSSFVSIYEHCFFEKKHAWCSQGFHLQGRNTQQQVSLYTSWGSPAFHYDPLMWSLVQSAPC